MNKQEFLAESARLGHAIQSGARAMEELVHKQPEATKHLRTGINVALCETSALGALLIKKGVITEEEYFQSVIAKLEEEVLDYERRLALALGHRITLG